MADDLGADHLLSCLAEFPIDCSAEFTPTLDGLELPLMFRRRFPRLIRRGDLLKDKELTGKREERDLP